MRLLELKIPPVLLCVLFAVAMWCLAVWLPGMGLSDSLLLVLCPALLLAGTGISIAGVLSFHRAETTVNPVSPQQTSSLVTQGVYRLSRNPMYVGFLCFLIAWGLWLDSAFALAMCGVYVWYMNRYQIEPEERALEAHFGQEFLAYKSQVRRWL